MGFDECSGGQRESPHGVRRRGYEHADVRVRGAQIGAIKNRVRAHDVSERRTRTKKVYPKAMAISSLKLSQIVSVCLSSFLCRSARSSDRCSSAQRRTRRASTEARPCGARPHRASHETPLRSPVDAYRSFRPRFNLSRSILNVVTRMMRLPFKIFSLKSAPHIQQIPRPRPKTTTASTFLLM